MQRLRPLVENVKLAILTPTMSSRAEFLERLGKCLGPQLARHPADVTWKVLPDGDRRFESLGAKRELMRQTANAEYISFVDDDDLVADDYVERILPLLDGVDYVGFRLQAYEDGVALPKPTYHSLLCGGWFESAYGYHRDISLLNPIRRELAVQVPIHYDFGEDSDWAQRMRATGLVRTEHYVEQTMYRYLSRPGKPDGLPVTRTAGKCPKCGSMSTVWVGRSKFCNQCGRGWDDAS